MVTADRKVLRLRKRPKETSSKARTSRVPFGNDYEKERWIPTITNYYNYRIGQVDKVNHLTAQNNSLR